MVQPAVIFDSFLWLQFLLFFVNTVMLFMVEDKDIALISTAVCLSTFSFY